MTTYEHAMLGVTGASALGLHGKYGGSILVLAGVIAITPDWDGLTFFCGMETFDQAHRAWGHNILVGTLVGALLAVVDYRFDMAGRARRAAIRLFAREKTIPSLRTRGERSIDGYLAWTLVGVLASLSHLPADMVVSGAAGLSDWHLQLFWPFSRRGFVFPLVAWGDVGATIIFVIGMFAMVRWPKRLQAVAVVTLLLVAVYIAGRGAITA